MTTRQALAAVTLTLEPIGAEEYRGRWAGALDRDAYAQSHYRATLHYDGRRATFRYAQGSAWHRRPVAREVLECVLSDVTLIDGAETVDEALEALRDNLGEEDGERRIAAGCLEEAKKLRRLLGDDFDEAVGDPDGYAWRVTDDPPEGLCEPLRDGERVYSGRVGVHRDGYPVRVTVSLRPRNEVLELSVTSSTPYSVGQDREALEGLATFSAPWDAASVARLREVWERWHLNGMRSAFAWLSEPLPADVVAWLETLPGLEREGVPA